MSLFHKNKKCRHDVVLHCSGQEDFAYCSICGLRTVSIPHNNFQWGPALFKRAEQDNTLFKDKSLMYGRAK
jgi:hypothetical protein